MLDRREHADRIIRTFLASEPDPDTRLAYLEAGATLAIFFQVSGARSACNRLIERLTQVAVDADLKDRGYLVQVMAKRALYLEPEPYQALGEARQATALFRDSGNRRWLAEALFVAGMALTDLGADGNLEGGRSALRSALEQLQLRAGKIEDAAMLESYLALPHHRQLVSLAREHGVL